MDQISILGVLVALGLSWGRLGASWGRLGVVLGHLGAVLGRLGELNTLILLVFFIAFYNIDVLSKHCYLGRSWAFLRTAWADLGPS